MLSQANILNKTFHDSLFTNNGVKNKSLEKINKYAKIAILR